MVTSEQVWLDGTLPGFNKLLREWISVIDRLRQEWEEDPDFPWWYNERACVGTFAAAVWLCGGLAFEEYLSEKVKDRAKLAKSQKKSPGRTDLYFSYHGNEYIVEAKQCWPKLESSKSPAKKIKQKLDDATKAAMEVYENYGTRLAMVFAVPRALQSSQGNLFSLMENWMSKVSTVENSYSARAFFFLESDIKAKDEDWIYPGVGLFIKKLATYNSQRI